MQWRERPQEPVEEQGSRPLPALVSPVWLLPPCQRLPRLVPLQPVPSQPQ
jgi:hypothetical protein